jgi:hypothetical protein
MGNFESTVSVRMMSSGPAWDGVEGGAPSAAGFGGSVFMGQMVFGNNNNTAVVVVVEVYLNSLLKSNKVLQAHPFYFQMFNAKIVSSK